MLSNTVSYNESIVNCPLRTKAETNSILGYIVMPKRKAPEEQVHHLERCGHCMYSLCLKISWTYRFGYYCEVRDFFFCLKYGSISTNPTIISFKRVRDLKVLITIFD